MLTGERAVATSVGTAMVTLTAPAALPRAGRRAGYPALVVLGHGAGGGLAAPDLVAVSDTLLAGGCPVAGVRQPYRVAGRAAPPAAARLDAAWNEVVAALLADPDLAGLPLVVGGRSSGARVACRTAAGLGAAGVLALAFPRHPPGRPANDRSAEIPGDRPVLVVQGDRDPFGCPEPGPGREVVLVAGDDHALRRNVPVVAAAVRAWAVRHGWAGA